MKTSKKIVSLVLCAVMVLSTFCGLGFVLGDFKADAAITLGGITQQRVVSNYESLYAGYQNRFFTGSESNEPTNFVIPGLSSSNDYTPQGMTYWEEKEWILISAYDASGSGKHSVIYAIDAVTTEFVALFKILNADGSVNTSHGGGIAASTYNFYYADTASKISYIPLSEMDVSNGTVKEIKLKGSINCGGELGGAATSYCCYEDGVLWAGNFYYSGDSRYSKPAHSASNSMIVGYRLHGNSSAEEWYYLSTNYNHIKLNVDSTDEQTIGSMKIKTFNTDGANAEIRGTITTDAALGEVTHNFCSMALTEGVKYKVEFIADNNLSDLYFFAPNGTHCNVKQSQASTITDLGNGKYHYQMIFTAGLKPTGADSSWPTTQSTDGSYTGTYTMRFDQDSVPAGGRSFAMTDISVTEYVEPNGFTPDSQYEGIGCAGNPTYVVMIAGIDKVQYAMVYKGKFYISRSWKRVSDDNHTRELMIGDIDLNSPGTSNLSINGRTRPCHMITLDNVTRFGGDNGSSNLNQMFYMGEALCVMNDFLYMFGEGAAWAYNGKESSKCPEPIDVIWKIDQHMIMGEERSYDDTAPLYYEKVNSLSEISLNDDYLIVHESSVKDPVTQENILYALDSYGGYGANKLPKQDAGTQANSADSMGMVGYEIRNYSVDTLDNGKQIIHVPEEVDTTKSLHWQIQGATTGNLRLNNKDLYYAKNNHLYFGSRLFAMTTDSRTNLNLLNLEQVGTGDFRLYYKGNANYYLWCNDGSNQSYIDTYTNYYSNHGKAGYVPQYHGLDEVPGTFHCDGDKLHATTENSGNYIGKSVGMDMQIIHIYKRVADPYSSAYDTRVSTDLSAELQADGTYNIKMETYAISELQFQTVEERPTDFIFVLDASGSMTNNKDARGYHTELKNWSALRMDQACGDVSESFFERGKNYNTAHKSKFYYKLPDGEFGSIYVAFNELGSSSKYERDIWLWVEHPVSKRCYRLSKLGYLTHGNFAGDATDKTDGPYRITEENFIANQQNLGWANQAAVMADVSADRYRTDYHSKRDSKAERASYQVLNYKYTDGYGDTRASYYSYGECYRLLAMQQAVEELTYKIADESTKTGFNHRIAVVTYGSDGNESWLNTGMYTNSSVSMVQYSGTNSISTANYQKAFYDTSNFSQVRRIVNNIVTWNQDPDTYSNYGFEMANNIITYSDANYLADGNRSACIVMITDGVPGIGNNNASVANSTANAAIAEAYKSKHQGAYVYTVQMGNDSASGFDMDKYMDYVSSEFIYAESMTNPGDRNTKDIAYRLNVPTGSSFNITNLVDGVYESVTSNSTNAIATLNENSILREHLTDAFVIPSDAKTTIQVAKHNYDGLGRLYFKEPTTASGITANLNSTTNEITVTGYDYSTRYVAKSNVGKGDKLIVTISGVIANADSKLLNNTSINQTETTAIYQNDYYMNADGTNENLPKNGLPVKRFPTYHFTIPEYTYYMDYDIPMYDSDINGTLCSVDSTLKKQSTYKTSLSTGNMGIQFVNNNLDMIYTLNSQAGLTENLSKGYVLIQRDDGTYDWFRLNIVPASTVYYEENKTDTLDGTQNFTEWTQVGSTSGNYQSLSTENDVFGSDSTYCNDTNNFSLGTHKHVTVTSTDKRSDTQTFTFTGTGFDLISACGSNTGIQTVTVKQHQDNGSMKIVKVFMVDTFYNDSTIGTVYQVPVVQFKGDHATYTVETTAAYYSFAGALNTQSTDTYAVEGTELEATTAVADTFSTDELFAQVGMDELIGQEVDLIWMDDDSVLNGGTGVEGATLSTQADGTTAVSLVNYIDGFRIYNPVDYNDEYIVSEKNATFYSVMDAITAGGIGGDSFAGYLEGGTTGSVFGDYLTSGGPKYEVYLAPGNSIAFRFKASWGELPLRAMVSVRAASGSPKAKFASSANLTHAYETCVLSGSETYYDITDNALGVDSSDDSFVLTVTNTGSGLLAVDNIKLTNASLVPINGVSLAELNDIISTQAVEVDPAEFSFAKTEAKYPDYVPGTPATEADPGLDEEGFIPDYVPDSSTNNGGDNIGNDNTPDVEEPEECLLKTFFNKVVAFFKNIFGYIKNLISIF